MPLQPDVRREVTKKIEEYEGRIDHLYLDSVGKVTVGVGHLIPNRLATASIKLHKAVNGLPTQPATPKEKEDEYAAIVKQKKGFKASAYKQYASLMMSAAEIDRLRDAHIDTFYRELTILYRKKRGYPNDFDSLPKDVQLALFDMVFNLGATKIVSTFPTFDRYLKKGDWAQAALASNRPQVSLARNRYVKDLLLSAAKPVVKK